MISNPNAIPNLLSMLALLSRSIERVNGGHSMRISLQLLKPKQFNFKCVAIDALILEL